MGNKTGKESDKQATGFSDDTQGKYSHSECAEILQGNDLTSRLELTFSAEKIKSSGMLGMGKHDPFLVLSKRKGTGFEEIARTEVIANNLNPKWVNRAFITYNRENQEKDNRDRTRQKELLTPRSKRFERNANEHSN